MFAHRVGFAVGVALVLGTGVASAQGDAGAKVFADKKCSMCHSVNGVGNKKTPLDGVGARLSKEEIREWLVNPQEAAAKAKATAKPVHPKLPPADLDALVAYLKTLDKK
jgi:mono/diheme cytochrome c family protein